MQQQIGPGRGRLADRACDAKAMATRLEHMHLGRHFGRLQGGIISPGIGQSRHHIIIGSQRSPLSTRSESSLNMSGLIAWA